MSLPTHHPGDELLMGYAGGGLGEPAALVVATHLAFCPGCRHAVTEMDAIGGALLEELEPEAVSSCCRDALFARLDDSDEPRPAPRGAMSPMRRDGATSPMRRDGATSPMRRDGGAALLPEPLRRHVGDLDSLRWRTLLPGIQKVDLPLTRGGAQLVRMRGGVATPQHSHEGMELVVVLQGGFSDALGRFGRGDVAVGDDSIDHRPVADPEGCLCLSVTLGRLRLTGPLGRLIDPFLRS